MSTALANFKRAHGVATHRLTGFADVAAEYSMAALEARNKVAEGVTEIEACQFLAERNGIPWPADEPKKRKAKP